jgi:hypothetical protein
MKLNLKKLKARDRVLIAAEQTLECYPITEVLKTVVRVRIGSVLCTFDSRGRCKTIPEYRLMVVPNIKDYQVEIEARERRARAIQTRLNATQQLTESQAIRIAAILDEPLVLL